MRLRRIVICFVVACGARTAPGTDGPGAQECPASRPSFDDVCAVGAPPFTCRFDGNACADGSSAQLVYTCYARGNNFKTWFFGYEHNCSCPASAPENGSACTVGDRCMYLVDECGVECSCDDNGWACGSTCGSACPVQEPTRFLPCPKSGVGCFYPHSNCNTIVACVAPLGAADGSPGVWATIESPDPCNDI